MENRMAKLISLIHKLPENSLDEAIAYMEDKVAENKDKSEAIPCPRCKSENVQFFGRRGEKQRYRCKDCSRIYTKTTNTAISHSHCGEALWKQVIRDTVEDIPLRKTASNLKISESTAFRMRHKILLALEKEESLAPTVFDGVCELDDTYVLESYKGSKLPEEFWRKPRKHGAVAQKRGISNEYVCISTGVDRNGKAISKTVTRATPQSKDIIPVFDKRIASESLILCDGASSYDALGEHCGCAVMDVTENSKGGKGFFNINTVNNFHGFIKGKLLKYRGVATKYLNRYNAFFSLAFRSDNDPADTIYNIMMANDGKRYHSVDDVTTLNLLHI